MTNITTHVLKDSGSRLGYYHSWWLPNTPVDGEQWAAKERIVGDKYSIGHRRSPDGKYRSGGPFYSLKFRTTSERSGVHNVYRQYLDSSGNSTSASLAYSGTFAVEPPWRSDFSYMGMYHYTTGDITSRMFVYGAQAFAALKPDKPDFSPLLSLVELVRELPSIWEAFRDFNKRYYRELARKKSAGVVMNRAGKYNLAIQFGIIPVVSDVINFIDALSTADKRFAQLIRDNGKWVRRRQHLAGSGYMYNPHSKEWELLPPQGGWTYVSPEPWFNEMLPGVNSRCYKEGSHATLVNKYNVSSRVWAVGKSKYHLPAYWTHTRDFKALKRKIYANMSLTPEVIYNLVPWSWLFDYFTTTGGLFAALSDGLSEDQVVFQYAYIMREEIYTDTMTYTQYMHTGVGTVTPVTCSIVREGTLRSRIEASLFGFGVSPEDLSPYQWSILGALGFSRL